MKNASIFVSAHRRKKRVRVHHIGPKYRPEEYSSVVVERWCVQVGFIFFLVDGCKRHASRTGHYRNLCRTHVRISDGGGISSFDAPSHFDDGQNLLFGFYFFLLLKTYACNRLIIPGEIKVAFCKAGSCDNTHFLTLETGSRR